MTLREHAPDAEPTGRTVPAPGTLHADRIERERARRRALREDNLDELWTDAAVRKLQSRAGRLLRRVPLPLRVAAGLAFLVYWLLTASPSDWLEFLLRSLG